MLIGDVPAAVVAVGHMRMYRRVEVVLAADVQVRVAVHADELGAEDALAVVVVQRLPRHEQLQELVASGTERADLGDIMDVREQGTEAGDTAFDLTLDENISRANAALRAGILFFGVADVVDHDADDPAIAAADLAGQRVGVIAGQDAESRVELLALRQPRNDSLRRGGCFAGRGRRCGRGSDRRSGRGCRGRRNTQNVFHPSGQTAAQRGIAGRCAAGQRQPCSRQTGVTKYGPSRNFHATKTSYCIGPQRTELCPRGRNVRCSGLI